MKSPKAPARSSVTVETLKALGSKRLAEILVAVSEDSPEVKRRLRLELAEQGGGDLLAAEIGKRLTAIRNASSFIDWQKRKDFEKDLDLQRELIAERVAKSRPDLALELMWRFMDLMEPVINRVDDSNGGVGDIFRQAAENIGEIATKARPSQQLLAERVFHAVTNNHYGEYDRLVPTVMPALGKEGASHLKAQLRRTLERHRPAGDKYDYQAAAAVHALQDIADGEGDVDAFIALVPIEIRQTPRGAAEIARRLLVADRANEALQALEVGRPGKDAVTKRDLRLDHQYSHLGHADWESVYIDALDAIGRNEKAQELRWSSFEKHLSKDRLKTYLKRLPDFDDVLAEEKALAHALQFPSAMQALGFFIEWPALAQAATLTTQRYTEIVGDAYYLLTPAAEAIEGKYPLAAVLLRRAMINDTLDRAKSTRYQHAARHLMECQSLHRVIMSYGNFDDHSAFLSALQSKHRRKEGFWGLFGSLQVKARTSLAVSRES